MKIFAQALCPLAVLVLSTGCQINFNAGIEGSGTPLTSQREVTEFHAIDIAGSATVTVLAGQAPSVTVTTDDNLVDLIETTVHNGRLRIRPTESIRPKTQLEILIETPQLSQLKVAGSADVSLKDLDEDQLSIDVAGSGKISGNGRAGKVVVAIAGTGNIDFLELVSDDVTLRIAGSGRGKVHATQRLEVQIAGSGDVRYVGEPAEVVRRIMGSGSIKPVTSANANAKVSKDAVPAPNEQPDQSPETSAAEDTAPATEAADDDGDSNEQAAPQDDPPAAPDTTVPPAVVAAA